MDTSFILTDKQLDALGRDFDAMGMKASAAMKMAEYDVWRMAQRLLHEHRMAAHAKRSTARRAKRQALTGSGVES